MQVTDPDPSPPVEQASSLQQPSTYTKATSPARPWRLAGLAALAVVLVIAAFAGTLLSRNGLPLGGRLTGTGPITPHVAPSVYMVDHDTMYAIDAAKGIQRWQTPTDGSFTPDPIIAHGVVYTSEIPNGLVAARRASDGAVLWSKLLIQAEGKRIALAGDTLYMTTDMFGGEILFPQFAHGVYALRASDGAIRWHHDTTDPVISPPLVVDGIVYAGVGASLVALRASDGTQLWQHPLAIGSQPYLALWLAFSAGSVYAYGRQPNPYVQPYSANGLTGDAAVFAVQASDGIVRWSTQLDGSEPYDEVDAPVIADGIVYARSDGFGSRALARGVPSIGGGLHALRASDGKLLWTYPTAYTHPVAAGGVVYAGDTSGNLIALHGTDGTVIWKQLAAGPARDYWQMSLTLANGILYVGVKVPDKDALSSSATLKALNASNGQQRWAYLLPGSSAVEFGTPVFAA
ncbi:MAG: outer membrane protein assembly factor BamB family protein [Ktedonobacterales bacterium]